MFCTHYRMTQQYLILLQEKKEKGRNDLQRKAMPRTRVVFDLTKIITPLGVVPFNFKSSIRK